MNYSGFLHLLHEEMTPGKNAVKKHIIRFRNQAQYQQCVALLNHLEPSLSNLSHVQPIKTIQALICSLQSCTKLIKCKEVLFIEEDTKINLHAFPTIQPTNRNYFKAFHAEQRIPWGVKQIKAPQIWSQSMGNRVKVGVIDTGVDYSHPDLKNCLSRGINLVHRNSPPFDDNGHGTHISGTIAAANQINGIIGVAPKASIYPIKAFDHNGSAYVSDIIYGIDWCVRNRMDVINMSFGMKNRSQSLLVAVRNAYRSGIIIVASSGNDGKSGCVDYPARFSQTLSVGATTKGKKIAPFSNRGKHIDIYAPGNKIISTWLGGKYNELSGTSMATSHVTGVIALILSVRPGIKPAQLKTLIKRAVVPLKGSTSENRKKPFKGQIDAVRALKYLSL